jgi:hypothetical protein
MCTRGIQTSIVVNAFQMSGGTTTARSLSVAFELPFATRLARHWVLSRMLLSAGGLVDHSTGSLHCLSRSSFTMSPETYVKVVQHGSVEDVSPSRRSGASMDAPGDAKPHSSDHCH